MFLSRTLPLQPPYAQAMFSLRYYVFSCPFVDVSSCLLGSCTAYLSVRNHFPFSFVLYFFCCLRSVSLILLCRAQSLASWAVELPLLRDAGAITPALPTFPIAKRRSMRRRQTIGDHSLTVIPALYALGRQNSSKNRFPRPTGWPSAAGFLHVCLLCAYCLPVCMYDHVSLRVLMV